MVRKLAAQVPESVSRLLRSTLIRTPPTWYTPVLSNPPPIHPSRSSAARHTRLPSGAQIPKYDDVYVKTVDKSAEGRTRTHQMKHLRERKPRAEAVVYEEDRIRRRFFADFPFEALRPTSLVEGREVRTEEDGGVRGMEWTRLDQRGAYATVENTIAFTLNLHHTFQKPMSEAYEIATSQFVDLRAHHEIATLAAEFEARAHGAEFKRDPFERVHAKEEIALSTLATYTTSTNSTTPSTKYKKPRHWSMTVPEAAQASDEYTGGQNYAGRWKLPPPLEIGASASEATGSTATADTASRRQSDEEEVNHGREKVDDEKFLELEMERNSVGARA